MVVLGPYYTQEASYQLDVNNTLFRAIHESAPFPQNNFSVFLKNEPVYFKAIKCETDTIYGFNLA